MKKFHAILAALLILALSVSASYAASKNADTKQQIQKYNAIAKQKSQESKNLLSQLSRLKKDANDSSARMTDLERDNRRLEASVNKLNDDIARANSSMTHILGMLRGRLEDMYKRAAEERTLALVLSSGGAHEAVNNAYMMNIIARRDIAMFNELNEQERRLEHAKSQLEADQSRIQKQTDELKRKRIEFDTAVKRTDKLLHTVQNEQKKAESASRELEKAQKAVGYKITNLQNRKEKKSSVIKITSSKQTDTQAAKKKAPAKSTPQPSSNGPISLSWPLNGRVTMQYGSRVHPVFKTKVFNSGIDIQAAAGTPVKAAGPGEVLYRGWLRGFGQVVIIDHGGNLSTVYAHLGGTSVNEGATVKTGTVIGRVGNTGTDQEYGLHFEVRRGGSAVNPMNYLRK
ncbi:MAG: peptidoglycan DD-metalloendopeptidase family protein [Synergistaceae bacterium]|nr:peptidoglycan DD-metalloendopeptidase family protein [Synergistaceae bacterium]